MPAMEDRQKVKRDRIEASHRCVAGQTALIVVDMQHGFLDPGAAIEVPKGRKIIPNLQRLIGEFEKL